MNPPLGTTKVDTLPVATLTELQLIRGVFVGWGMRVGRASPAENVGRVRPRGPLHTPVHI